MKSPLPLAFIGGSLQSAVGRTHHIATRMDNRWRIVCGSFSRSQQVCSKTADALSLPASAAFTDYREMLDKEKPDLVAIGPRWATEHHALALAAPAVLQASGVRAQTPGG